MQCLECDRHEDAHQAAMDDAPPDQAYLVLNLLGWAGHLIERHFGGQSS